ncbi:MAG: hypothetical protein CL596_06145 [Alteromonas sp.]|nr:hypothetical protein [Alteromonas sp.]MAY23734.1 hypothetical protein [Flavobacteriaceae bacterium]|tara:strand:+ start:20584 stop:22038 length:1455 start_codon:yes stop_codon:yes gene_type:complete
MRAILFFLLGVLSTISFSQDGSPDLSFGNNGVWVHELSGDNHFVEDFVETETGQILVIFKTNLPSENLIRVIAFTETGAIDSSFANDGLLVLPYAYFDTYNLKIHALADGKFLISRTENNILFLSRFLNNGAIDITFGNSGTLQPFSNEIHSGFSVSMEDPYLLTLGLDNSGAEKQLLLKKFDANGTLDTSFGDNGLASYTLGDVSNPSAGNLISFGTYIYFGITYTQNSNPFKKIIRFLSNGVIDGAFGENGAIINPIEEEYNTHFSIFENGSFLIGGSYYDNSSETLYRKTIKLDPQGVLIENFGDNGFIEDFTQGMIQENQRFLCHSNFSDWEGGITPNYGRFFSNGASDSSFQFQYNYLELGSVVGKLLQSGKLLLVGTDIWYNGPEINIVLQRYNNDPLEVNEVASQSAYMSPNPSSSIFTVYSNIPFERTPYQVFDVSGKKIKEGFLTGQNPSIDLSHFEAGIYFMKFGSNTFKLLKT